MKNKRIILMALLCISIGSTSFAQDTEKENTGKKKVEFNIGISNIFAKSNWDLLMFDYYDNYFFDPQELFLPQHTSLVAGMKSHNKKGAIRLSTSINYSNQNYDDPDDENDENNYQSFSLDLNLGHEWHINYERVTVFYGFDITGGIHNMTLTQKDLEDNYERKYKINNYGFSPLIGMNYFISPKVSIGTEVKYIIMGYTGSNEYTHKYTDGTFDPQTMSSKSNYDGFKTYFGPLGYLSINIYF